MRNISDILVWTFSSRKIRIVNQFDISLMNPVLFSILILEFFFFLRWRHDNHIYICYFTSFIKFVSVFLTNIFLVINVLVMLKNIRFNMRFISFSMTWSLFPTSLFIYLYKILDFTLCWLTKSFKRFRFISISNGSLKLSNEMIVS